MTADYARERDADLALQTSIQTAIRSMMDSVQVKTTLPASLRREIRRLNIMVDIMRREIAEAELRMECNQDILDAMEDEE